MVKLDHIGYYVVSVQAHENRFGKITLAFRTQVFRFKFSDNLYIFLAYWFDLPCRFDILFDLQ